LLLRELRESAGLSQEALSNKIGRPITYMGKVELGTRRIDLIETMEICQALGQEPAELVRELGRRLRS
jgi:transcriptional regulator with XRE-family HTH domain